MLEDHEMAAKRCGPLKVGGSMVRFLRSRGVSCGTATSVYTAYVHKASRGQCEGNGCYAKVKGWDCVENISAVLQEETGEVANCEKKSAGIRVLAAKPSSMASALMMAKAPCTAKAIKAGLGHGNGRLLGKSSFKCAGRFAYADVKIQDYEAVQLLRAFGRHWQVVDRGKYCEAGVVPTKIRYFACEVS